MADAEIVQSRKPYVGDPWVQQPWEGTRWYHNFAVYLSLPAHRRSIAAAKAKAEEEGTARPQPVRQWEAASSRNQWVERAGAYEQTQNLRLAEALAEDRIEMLKRHAGQARDAQDTLRRILGRAHELLEDAASGLNTMSLLPRTITREMEDGRMMRIRQEGLLNHIPAVVRALTALAGEERVAMGGAERRIELTGPGGSPLGAQVQDEQVDAIVDRLEALVAATYGGADDGGETGSRPSVG